MKFEIEISEKNLEKIKETLVYTSDANFRTKAGIIRELFLFPTGREGYSDFRRKVKIKKL